MDLNAILQIPIYLGLFIFGGRMISLGWSGNVKILNIAVFSTIIISIILCYIIGLSFWIIAASIQIPMILLLNELHKERNRNCVDMRMRIAFQIQMPHLWLLLTIKDYYINRRKYSTGGSTI